MIVSDNSTQPRPDERWLTVARAPWLAWSLFALVLALVLAAVVFYALNLESFASTTKFITDVLYGLTALPFAAVAAMISSRQPRNSVGWMLFVIAFSIALNAAALGYSKLGLARGEAAPLTLFVAWLANWVWVPFIVTFTAIPLMFPTGRPPTPRWRWLVLAMGGAGLAMLCFGWFETHFNLSGGPNLLNPIGFIPDQTVALLFQLVFAAFCVLSILALISLFVRYRRAGVEERRQIKWLLYAFALYLTVGLASRWLLNNANFVVSVIQSFLICTIPISIGIAILRYRLWDIDLLINRTLLYGALSAFVVGAYVLIVGGLGSFVGAQGVAFVPALIATALIALAFQPLRDWLQGLINRLIYGQRDEPYAVITRLGQQLEATPSPEVVLPAIAETVGQSLRLPRAEIAVREGDGWKVAAVYERSGGSVSSVSSALLVPLSYQGEPIGELRLCPRGPNEPFSPADRRLVEDIAHQAGLAIHTASLTADLKRARERLIAAREEERRTLRRELHDGLGPMLANFAMQLDAARDLLPPHAAPADAVLAGLTKTAQAAVADVRQLVFGLRPPALDELGLVSALRLSLGKFEQAQAAKGNGGNGNGNGYAPRLVITLDAPDALPPLPAAVEVAAYHIVMEAVTNVVRHARARQCVVIVEVSECHVSRVTCQDARADMTLDTRSPDTPAPDTLTLSISDDGIGLPSVRRASAGVGLGSMRERAEELGGTWAIESAPGGGTRISACLPIGLASGADKVEAMTYGDA